MKVNFLGRVHEGFETYSDPDPVPFSDYELKEIENKGVDEIWYWYHSGNYEGSGQILMRRGDLYDIHNAGHCSCYGPTNDIEFNGKQLEELAKSLSKEYMEKEARELFAMAGYTFQFNTMTNEQKIKAYLAAGHYVKVGENVMTLVHDNGSRFISSDGSEFYYSELERWGIEPLPLPPPPYKEGDKVIILDVAREVAGYSYWDQKKKDMVGKVFTIDSIDYCINIGPYSFPYFAVAPYFDDEKQTKIQELESQLATIAKELELLKK